ncbi:MAG: hypothetical protein HY673_17295 [Chloroflexi bacterium]|nr:hypothetical protein [Chloroflexota bacterium]
MAEYELQEKDGTKVLPLEGDCYLRPEGWKLNGVGDVKATISIFQGDSLKFRDQVNLSRGDTRRKFSKKVAELVPGIELDVPLIALDELLRHEPKRAAKTPEGEGDYSAVLPGLVDIVEQDGKPAYLFKKGDDVEITTTAVIDGKTYQPPPKESIPWLLARAGRVIDWLHTDTDAALFAALCDYHQAISDLPDGGFYHLLAAWDMHTYMLECVDYSPILCFYAVPERGKSRTGRGSIYVCYRGLTVESLRDPYIVRMANNFTATLFFDVKEIWKKAEKAGSEDILLNRFEKGAKVPRVLYPDKGAHKDTVYYSIFGPTIIATNEPVHHILETRAIQINMPEASRQFEDSPTPEGGRELKERLTAFRARHLSEKLPQLQKPARGRLGDITRPLFQIVEMVMPERRGSLMELVSKLEQERLTDKVSTLEARLLWIVAGLGNKVVNGALYISDVADTFNEGKPDRFKATPERVGRVLKSLGFEKSRGEGGKTVIRYDTEKIEKLLGAYGLRNPSVLSEHSEPSPNEAGKTNVPDEGTERSEGTEGFPGAHTPEFSAMLSLWEKIGRPLIHLRPGENCQDLEALLSAHNISPEHLGAVRAWYAQNKSRVGGG